MSSDNEQIVEQFFNLPPRDQSKTPLNAEGQVNAGVPGTVACPPIELIWQWLAEIPDPEIPVISLLDLGIVRELHWQEELLVITITPTYSGCPASQVIQKDIELHLRKRGITHMRLIRQLSPAWTTDWISKAGRDKLQRYGIAPPQPGVSGVGDGAASAVICPRCKSEHTRKVSQFGSTPCKASYQCNDCLEPFDYFKCL